MGISALIALHIDAPLGEGFQRKNGVDSLKIAAFGAQSGKIECF